MPIYAEVGTANCVICASYLKPEGYIEMGSKNPNPEKYIACQDGSWILNRDYKALRKAEILISWPIEKQLEALTEYLDTPSRPEKMKQLEQFIHQVKLKYPKTGE